MISKVILGSGSTSGSTFYGVCRYVMNKKDSEVLFSNGVRSDTVLNATTDFETIRQLRPQLRNVIIHTSLNFSYEDTPELTNERMSEVSNRFLEKMGLSDNQALCVRHHDAKHSHCHLIVNRLDWSGNATSDSFIKNRAARACDELEIEFGLTVARGHGASIKHRWSEKDAMKDEFKDAIQEAIKTGVNSLEKMKDYLQAVDIEMQIQYQSTGRVNGLSFRKGEIAMKGSAIDKSLSYKRLAKSFESPSISLVGHNSFSKGSLNEIHDGVRSKDKVDKKALHIEKQLINNKQKGYER